MIRNEYEKPYAVSNTLKRYLILTCFRLKVNNLKQINYNFLVQNYEGDKMYQRIRDLREDKDMTQTQIAKILGMSQTGYSKYETGENDIPTSILIALANFYDTSIDYLLGQTNKKERNK